MDSLLEFQAIHCKIIWLIFLPPPGKNILSFLILCFRLLCHASALHIIVTLKGDKAH